MNAEYDKEKWLIRPLKPEDFNDIAEISKDIWDGYDYLPKIFYEWVKAQGLFLGMEDIEKHKIVSVGKYSYLFDSTGWLEGLRVHPSYRNLGLSKALLQVLFDRALQDLRQNKIQRIANCTHATNQISIHLSLSHGFSIQQRYLVVEAEKTLPSIEPSAHTWQPTFEELQRQPYFQKTNGYICQSFLVQSINLSWFNDLKKKVQFAIVNGCPGWIDPSLEPYVQLLDPTPQALVAWLQYGAQVLGKESCMTFLYPEASLIEALKSQPVQTWMNYEPDCLYLVYQPEGSQRTKS